MRFAPKGNDYSLDRYRTQVRRTLAVLERKGSRRCRFSSGASDSIADIATCPWAGNVGTFLGKAAEADYPKLMAWVEIIAARPAVKRALAAIDDVRAKNDSVRQGRQRGNRPCSAAAGTPRRHSPASRSVRVVLVTCLART
jgi:hypothetical protein